MADFCKQEGHMYTYYETNLRSNKQSTLPNLDAFTHLLTNSGFRHLNSFW